MSTAIADRGLRSQDTETFHQHTSYSPAHSIEDSEDGGPLELTVILPDRRSIRMLVDPQTPIMDLLIQITSANKLSPSDHVINAISEETNRPIDYKASHTIASLGVSTIYLIPKTTTVQKPKRSSGKKPFEVTNRLVVNLPRNQKMIMRISHASTLAEIFRRICEEKNLDPYKYELQHPKNRDEPLNMARPLAEYNINEITVVNIKASADVRKPLDPSSVSNSPLGNSTMFRHSTSDIPNAVEGFDSKEKKKKKGFFSFLRRDKKSKSELKLNKDPNFTLAPHQPANLRQKPQAEVKPQQQVRPNTIYSTDAPSLQTPNQKQAAKKRHAPPPPPGKLHTQQSPADSVISSNGPSPLNIIPELSVDTHHSGKPRGHSRNSSDSSGYHENAASEQSPNSSRESKKSSYVMSIDGTSIESGDIMSESGDTMPLPTLSMVKEVRTSQENLDKEKKKPTPKKRRAPLPPGKAAVKENTPIAKEETPSAKGTPELAKEASPPLGAGVEKNIAAEVTDSLYRQSPQLRPASFVAPPPPDCPPPPESPDSLHKEYYGGNTSIMEDKSTGVSDIEYGSPDSDNKDSTFSGSFNGSVSVQTRSSSRCSNDTIDDINMAFDEAIASGEHAIEVESRAQGQQTKEEISHFVEEISKLTESAKNDDTETLQVPPAGVQRRDSETSAYSDRELHISDNQSDISSVNKYTVNTDTATSDSESDYLADFKETRDRVGIKLVKQRSLSDVPNQEPVIVKIEGQNIIKDNVEIRRETTTVIKPEVQEDSSSQDYTDNDDFIIARATYAVAMHTPTHETTTSESETDTRIQSLRPNEEIFITMDHLATERDKTDDTTLDNAKEEFIIEKEQVTFVNNKPKDNYVVVSTIPKAEAVKKVPATQTNSYDSSSEPVRSEVNGAKDTSSYNNSEPSPPGTTFRIGGQVQEPQSMRGNRGFVRRTASQHAQYITENEQENVLSEKSISRIALPALDTTSVKKEGEPTTINVNIDNKRSLQYDEKPPASPTRSRVETEIKLAPVTSPKPVMLQSKEPVTTMKPDTTDQQKQLEEQYNQLQQQFSMWQDQLLENQKLLAEKQIVPSSSSQLQTMQKRVEMQQKMMSQLEKNMQDLKPDSAPQKQENFTQKKVIPVNASRIEINTSSRVEPEFQISPPQSSTYSNVTVTTKTNDPPNKINDPPNTLPRPGPKTEPKPTRAKSLQRPSSVRDDTGFSIKPAISQSRVESSFARPPSPSFLIPFIKPRTPVEETDKPIVQRSVSNVETQRKHISVIEHKTPDAKWEPPKKKEADAKWEPPQKKEPDAKWQPKKSHASNGGRPAVVLPDNPQSILRPSGSFNRPQAIRSQSVPSKPPSPPPAPEINIPVNPQSMLKPSKPRKVNPRFEPQLDPREELMIAIRNTGGRSALRKVTT
ncbi:unnamed protein product [Owenia fusiformis]|uniref:Uncharacterized protein n=1 Tax=Owenia fusiformis TaxID=6347 RepID=A0A8J1UFS2_OWEFU|nr:unnamed protein product [Owenia fusiformis]